MKFAVCGDSWFCSDKNFSGQSFAEIISDRTGWELISLARSGCSNFCIALQVDKAIELQADVILVGATNSARIEIPLIKKQKNKWQSLWEKFSWEYWFYHAPSTFDPEKGLANIYYNQRNLSSDLDFFADPTVISESMNNIVFGDQTFLTADQISALKHYMLHLYDDRAKRLADAWILSDACRRLMAYDRPWLFCSESIQEESHNFFWIPQKNILTMQEFQFGALPRNHDAWFHYCPESGAPVFANHIQNRLNSLMEETP